MLIEEIRQELRADGPRWVAVGVGVLGMVILTVVVIIAMILNYKRPTTESSTRTKLLGKEILPQEFKTAMCDFYDSSFSLATRPCYDVKQQPSVISYVNLPPRYLVKKPRSVTVRPIQPMKMNLIKQITQELDERKMKKKPKHLIGKRMIKTPGPAPTPKRVYSPPDNASVNTTFSNMFILKKAYKK